MASSPKKKLEAIGRIANGEKPKDIATEIDIGYATVLRWKREYDEAIKNDNLTSIIDVDAVVLQQLADGIKDNMPSALAGEIDNTIVSVVEAKGMLEVLQDDFIATAKSLNTKIRSYTLSCDDSNELQTLVTSLCDLQSAFFNKNQTNVQVNNYPEQSDKQYGAFLNDKPAV